MNFRNSSAENIKVRFYEIDEYGNIVWKAEGKFSEADVHHQYAIALKTPPYENVHIDKSVSQRCGQVFRCVTRCSHFR